ncbi:MAG: GGDEF domain-containing protein [Myxococcota bacterium]
MVRKLYDDDPDEVYEEDEMTTIASLPVDLASPPAAILEDSPCATLTVLTGPETGRTYLVDGSAKLGRGARADVRVFDNNVSRTHARVFMDAGQWFLEDLGSQNGTFFDDQRIRCVELPREAIFRLGPLTGIRFEITSMSQATLQRKLYETSTRDALTQIYNRKYFDERLRSEISYAIRHGKDLCVLLFDIDHFKHVNDRYGHAMGDEVLRQLARTVGHLIRAEDVLCRHGGEEFAVVARGIAAAGAVRLAERIREGVEAMQIALPDQGALRVTVSIGVAMLDCVNRSRHARALVVKADERLYEAKGAGRNRVVGPE